jgi:uncharacterized membrane protein
MPNRLLPRSLKILHTLGAVGTLGALAACLVLVMTAPREPLTAYAAVRVGIATIARFLLVPSLMLVLLSGLLSLAANTAYLDAGWAWVKALLGVTMFEGTLLSVAGSARRAAELAALAASGSPDPVALAEAVRTERGGLWLMIALSVANIVLGIWRPRFGGRRST